MKAWLIRLGVGFGAWAVLLLAPPSAGAQRGSLPDGACVSPPPMHCPRRDCSPDIIMFPGTATVSKSRRAFFLDYPCDLTPSEPVTFILSLHGGGMNGNWQRHYFPLLDFKDRYRLVIATPSASNVLWSAENDDAHLRQVVSHVYETLGASRIKAFWIVGHSHGGGTAYRLLTTPFYRTKLTGWVSLSGGRLGSRKAYFTPLGAPSPYLRATPERPFERASASAPDGGPGVGLTDATTLPDYAFSHIYAAGEYEFTEAGLPTRSAWAERLRCGAQTRGPDITDARAGYVWDSRSPKTRSPSAGRQPRPGTARIYTYPGCATGHVVTDVVRLDKGHSEGLEPNVTEAIIRLMLSATVPPS